MFGDRNTARPVRRFNPDAAMVVVLAIGFVLFSLLVIADFGWWSIPIFLFVAWWSTGG